MIGIDFGTTNSSLAWTHPGGEVELAQFSLLGATTESYRSLLYLEQQRAAGRVSLKSWSGPAGIEHYLDSGEKGRLVQSLKSFLSARSFQATEIFGRPRTIEELIARILDDLRREASARRGVEVREAIVGRPVRFVGADTEADNDFALTRLAEAFRLAGFDRVEFELEPVAAARYYASRLDHDELVLIGDFGGGTSDFSLVNVGPRGRHRIRGNAGVGLAGDAFDAKIVRHAVAPRLGAGTQWRSLDKVLPVPMWIYASLERWHHLSFLKTKEVTSALHSVRAQADEPEMIEALIELVKNDLGFPLHRAVQLAKNQLSTEESTVFRFSQAGIELEAPITRAQFESWIAEDLARLEECVDSLLAQAGAAPADIDRVFLTGGTSYVPAVRRLFAARFTEDRLASGHEFTAVARGLALAAASHPTRPGRRKRAASTKPAVSAGV